MLRRFLSEVHGYRQLGNVALRELEDRLAAIASPQPAEAQPLPAQRGVPASAAPLKQRSLKQPDDRGPALKDRLRELSAYLHADLSQQAAAAPAAAPAESADAPARQIPLTPFKPGERSARPTLHRTTPNAPILDRIWFEDRFATMRSSIDMLAEKIPTQRLDLLERQFHLLMEKLESRETDRSMVPVEAGLKKLAAYLEDNKHWSVTQDARVRGVEERLNQLSGLVAQSHAAISATAKGLEIVARGTGPTLARATADLVAGKLEAKLDTLAPKSSIADLSREVSHLAMQSAHGTRSTEERLKQLQSCLDESLDRLEDEARRQPQAAPEPGWKAAPADHGDFDDEDDYDGKLIAAAQRAARLADGPARQLPQHGEPVRYQIPYGEFLPEDERGSSRTGLVVAAIILLLASAAMLYLNLRDRIPPGAQASAALSDSAASAAAMTTSSTGKSAERIGSTPSRIALSQDHWVTIPAEKTAATLHPKQTAPAALSAAEPVDTSAPAATMSIGSTGKGDSLRKAAVDGDANAQFSVGQTYLEGSDADQAMPVDERLSKAARWFRRAAENGHAPSQYRLAILYEKGRGAPKSLAEAARWYGLAAEQGHVEAMSRLAGLLSNRNNPTLNYALAAKWYRKAAEAGVHDSQYNLGILYEIGLGVPKDAALAYQWFALAARDGDGDAVQKRDNLAPKLTQIQRATAEFNMSNWKAARIDPAINGVAPEPPVETAQRVQPVIQPKLPSTQLINAAWKAEIAPRESMVADAQALLTRLGYKPGPVDGVLGPKTIAAIHEFEQRVGQHGSGQLTEALVAKMKFAQQ
ncbi:MULTISPECIES: SEL1-like repeat protein [Rhodomicrobium]|uniref:SEL1-like repeat protein n=1 Tax=Rhodomicrobium TaxID=1068 RepID=UPI0014834D45|nr:MULTISPECIES: SEL1-like repeat protein [Rhodomicrobium]